MKNVIALEINSIANPIDDAFAGKIHEKIKVDLSGDVVINTASEDYSLSKEENFKIDSASIAKLFLFFNSFEHTSSTLSNEDGGMWVLSIFFNDGSVKILSDSFTLSKDTLICSNLLRVLLNRPTIIALDKSPKRERVSSFSIILTKDENVIEKIIFNEGDKTLKLYKNEGFKEKFIELKLQLFQLERIERCFFYEFFLEGFKKEIKNSLYKFSFKASTLYHGQYNFNSSFYEYSLNLPLHGLLVTLREITKESSSFILFSKLELLRRKDEYYFAKVSFEDSTKNYSFVTLNPYIKEDMMALVETNNVLTKVRVNSITLGDINESPYPFSKIKGIDSLTTIDNPVITPVRHVNAIEHFYNTTRNGLNVKNPSSAFSIINAISILLSSDCKVYIPTQINKDIKKEANYYLINTEEESLLPCFFNEDDFTSDFVAVLQLVSIQEYVRILFDLSYVSGGFFVYGNENKRILKPLIRKAMLNKIYSSTILIDKEQEELSVDVKLISNKSKMYEKLKEKDKSLKARGLIKIKGLYIYAENELKNIQKLLNVFDMLSDNGYLSISIKSEGNAEFFESVAKIWQTLHKDKFLDIYICK